jgi:hypothetical protein
MAGTCGGQDTIEAGGDTQPGQALEQLLAQRRQPQRRAVVEQAGGVGAVTSRIA